MDQTIHAKITTVHVWWEDIKANIPVYLVTGNACAVIDTGPPQRKPGSLAEALKPINLVPGQIDMALLTHGHLDHVGGLPELKAAGPVQIMIGREDAFLLTDHSKAFDEFYAVGDKMLSGKEDVSEIKKGFLMGAGPEFTPDRLLQDGDIIDLGGVELKAVHLPGHSMGSMGYLLEKEGIMICGDAIPALSGPDGSLPILMDLKSYSKTIERVMQMSLQTLVFTHGYRGRRMPPATVRHGAAQIKEYLEDAMAVADALIEALGQASTSAVGKPFLEVADQVIATMPAEMGFVPLAKQFTPQFSVSTIYWGLARVA